MTDGKTVIARRVLSGVALAMVLAGACSPAPVASEAPPKEAAVDAFNRHGAVVATAPKAEAVSSPAAKEAPVQVAELAMPADGSRSVVPAALPATQATGKPQTAAPTPPAAAAAALRPGTLPDTPGKATVQRVCSSCHAIGMVTAKGRTEDGWSEVIGQMIGNGMEASDDDLQTIHAYLTREFPPK